MFKPELLSPAGSLEKLKASVSYGADAVYLAGQKFGLRSAADNFTIDELEEGIEYARARGAKVYTVLNSFLHDDDLQQLPEFIAHLSRLQVDAVIASDLGVITTVARASDLPIHLSTQASCLNDEAALLWRDLGVKRLILGREASIEDARRIKSVTGLEVELFIHGSMCMAYAGNCTISNFTQGRDSNRGGCAQSCRFSYSLEYAASSEQNTFFMSSKDLMGLELLPNFFEAGIDSLKIEGRMRSSLYAGVISKVYREAIETYHLSPEAFLEQLSTWKHELSLIPHREYSHGSLDAPAAVMSVNKHSTKPAGRTEYEFVGLVRRVVPLNEGDSYLLVEVRNPFTPEDTIELVPHQGAPVLFKPVTLKSAIGETIPMAKPTTLVRIPYLNQASEGQILRKLGRTQEIK